jgi:hypothetical protein
MTGQSAGFLNSEGLQPRGSSSDTALPQMQSASESAPSAASEIFLSSRETEPERALYTTKKLQGETQAGLVTIQLDMRQMANVNRLLGWPTQGALRRDEAIGVRAQSFFYSLHKLYNVKTGKLSLEAVILHGKDGQVLAHKLSRDLDSEPPCDACGIPSYGYTGGGT